MFAIVTWGATASGWLARALNSHHSIYCSHNGRLPAQAIAGESVDAVRYMKMLSHMGYHYPIIGDVHGVMLGELPSLYEQFGDRLRSAVVVREPIARFRSQLSLFHEYEFDHWGDLSYLRPMLDKKGVEFDTLNASQKHYLHGANLLNNIVEETEVGPIFRMEDLTTNTESLLELANHVAHRELDFAETWSQNAIQVPRLNRHKSPAVDERLARESARICVKPEAWNLYAKLGYQIPDDWKS